MRELKAEKIRGLDEAEILAKIKERTEELFHLRFRNQMRQLTNPVLIRERRRDVARLRTILAEIRKGKNSPAVTTKEKKA
jgi:large subunit ribosomal protein L29